ncbi:hypothetical protein ACFQ46_22120 [Kineococcus sp. GCM10028916]|uniref:hypothetical protein n=1 Tax=Kineococcus sp. GCM10028916 TaxID=3273394 RepID=UPI0036278330
MSLLVRRPARYVPRHSTRELARQWSGDQVIDLTDTGEAPAQDVLASVLAGLDELDRAGRA